MSLDEVSKLFGIASKGVTILAILVGGAWASWRFLIRREHVWNLQIGLGLDQIPLMNNLALSNVGNVKIVPGPSGCWVSVRQVDHSLKHSDIVSWDEAIPVADNIDALRHYKKGDTYPDYEIEPGCEYHEIENVAVQAGFVYLVKVQFWWKKDSDSIEEYGVIQVPRKGSRTQKAQQKRSGDK